MKPPHPITKYLNWPSSFLIFYSFVTLSKGALHHMSLGHLLWSRPGRVLLFPFRHYWSPRRLFCSVCHLQLSAFISAVQTQTPWNCHLETYLLLPLPWLLGAAFLLLFDNAGQRLGYFTIWISAKGRCWCEEHGLWRRRGHSMGLPLDTQLPMLGGTQGSSEAGRQGHLFLILPHCLFCEMQLMWNESNVTVSPSH